VRWYGRLLVSALYVAGALWNVATRGPVVVAAAQESSEVYKNVYGGWKWWHVYCYRCHGQNAVGSTLGPSLIEPNAKLTLPEFLKKVRNGNPDKGMQAWDKLLDDKQITEIYNYVRARADNVLPPGRPDEIGPNGGPWVPPSDWPKRK
jgi:mono/diheme cytochrome c family protein